MPLVKNPSGEAVSAECVNKCGQLAKLDQKLALVALDDSEPQPVTVLICPTCQYCELYYGAQP